MANFTIMFASGCWQIAPGQTEDGKPYLTDGTNTYFYEASINGRLNFAQRNDLILPHAQEMGYRVGEFYYCKPGRSKRQSKKAREHALRYHKRLI